MQKYKTIFFLFVINSVLLSSVPDEFLFTIRDPKTDRKKFRDTLESIGEYVALDVLNVLPTKKSLYKLSQEKVLLIFYAIQSPFS